MLPIISAEERLKERHSAKVGLVGFPGVGKTTQLRTLPADHTVRGSGSRRPLGADWPGDTVRPRTWQEFRDLVVFLAGPMPTAIAEQAFSQGALRACLLHLR
jgi:GTPase SAR1 family protein